MSSPLGTFCQITIGTNNVDESYFFYKRLGFRLVAEDNTPYNWKKITDGCCSILLYENGNNYLGITYFSENVAPITKQLYNSGIRFVQHGVKENIFITPDDTIITLFESDNDGRTLPFKIKRGRLPAPLPNPILGIFAELSIPVEDLYISTDFYQKMGFKKMTQSETPYPRNFLYDGLISVGLHQTTEFDNQILTYYTNNVTQKMNQLIDLGIESITQYHGSLPFEGEHIVIRTPENLQIFLIEI